MPFVEGNNVLQVNLNGTYLGVPVQNNLYFHKVAGTPITFTDADNLATAIGTWWVNNIAGLLSDELLFDEIYMTDLTTQSSPTYDFVASLNGVKTSNPMPGSIAIAVGFLTAGRGRSSRGRNYLCGLTEVDVNNNAITQALADLIEQGYANLGAAVSAVGFEWIVFSRYYQGSPRLFGLSQPVITTKVADIRVDTQRRRLKP